MRLGAFLGMALWMGLLVTCGRCTSPPAAPTPAAPATPTVGSGGGRTQIVLIPHAHVTPYEKAVHAGAAKAIGEMKKGPDGRPAVDLLWQPPEESAAEGQVKVAQGLIKTGIAAIIIEPDDEKTLAAIVAAAAPGRVPVIAIDCHFNGEGCKSVISSDEHEAAELAAPFGGKARIVAAGDDPEGFLPGLKSGDIPALVLPDPLTMGYQSVKTAVDCIKEKKVDKQIDIPLHVATKDNLDDPEIAALLHPPVGKYLGE